MVDDKILFIDTETGGIDPTKYSLLSLGLAIWRDFRVVDRKEILINDGKLCATKEALKINNIKLATHKKVALHPKQAILEMENLLSRHFDADEKITLGGHNITFDVNFLRYFLVANDYQYARRFSHRHVDTATILYYLYLVGKIDQKVVSSSEAFKFFGVRVEGRHTALGDAVATARLFTKLLQIIRRGARKRSSLKSNSPTLFG